MRTYGGSRNTQGLGAYQPAAPADLVSHARRARAPGFPASFVRARLALVTMTVAGIRIARVRARTVVRPRGGGRRRRRATTSSLGARRGSVLLRRRDQRRLGGLCRFGRRRLGLGLVTVAREHHVG